jgi:hypothetical protein
MKYKRAPPPPRNISLHRNQKKASRIPAINVSPSTGEDYLFSYSLAINFILIMGIMISDAKD